MLSAAFYARGQYNYFDIIEGEVGDTISEATVSIELSQDGYVSWGLFSTVDYNHVYLYEYNTEGERIDSNTYTHPGEFVFIGSSQTFITEPQSSGYLFSCGIFQDDNSFAGYTMSFSGTFDINYAERYSPYPYTYFRGLESFGDEIISLGDYSPDNGFVGSFIQRTDLAGEVLSNTVLHPYEFGANYSNSYIEQVADKYFISGLVMDNGDLYGLLSITDLEGNLQEEIEYYDQSYGEWSPLGVTQLTDGELMVVQSLGYEEYDDPLNQGFYWKNIRLAKIDPETGEEYWNQAYLVDYELISGRWIDIEPTEDGGLIILGIAYSPEITIYSYLLKIDAAGNQEWIKDFWKEESAINWLRDVEVAHDGGYIMAGTIENNDIDEFTRAWVLKVDACGDEQWEDCQPLSTEVEDVSSTFKVFPNPP